MESGTSAEVVDPRLDRIYSLESGPAQGRKSGGTMSSSAGTIGRRVIAEAIRDAGIDTVFTVAGGHFLGTYNELGELDDVSVICARHEQGAGYMASGYGLVSGKPGVVFSGAPGPGATNLVTAVANAYADSIPLLVLSAQVDRRYVHRNILQYCDNVSLFEQFTKSSLQAVSLDEIPNLVASGLQLAMAGRPGPVHIALPQNLQADSTDEVVSMHPIDHVASTPAARDIDTLAPLINAAQRPAILAGHGVIRSSGSAALTSLAERIGAPVATSRSGVGSIRTDHEAAMGMLGFYGSDSARECLAEADLVLIAGCALGEQTTFGWRSTLFGTDTTLAQIDIDPSQINRIYTVDAGVVGDAGATLSTLHAHVEERSPWFTGAPQRVAPQNDPARGLSAATVLQALNQHTPDDVVVSADIGNHRLWVCDQLDVTRPDGLLQSCEFDAMGFSLPAAIGSAIALKGTKHVAIAGDGGFVHTMGELVVAAEHELPLVTIVFVDGALGILKHQAEEMYGKDEASSLGQINFADLAQSMGVDARTVASEAELEPAVEWAMAANGPTLLAIQIDPEEVFPPLRVKIEQRKIDLIGPANS